MEWYMNKKVAKEENLKIIQERINLENSVAAQPAEASLKHADDNKFELEQYYKKEFDKEKMASEIYLKIKEMYENLIDLIINLKRDRLKDVFQRIRRTRD